MVTLTKNRKSRDVGRREATHDDKNASGGSRSARKEAYSKGNQTVEIHRQIEPVVQFKTDNGCRDANASCQHMLYPGDHGRKCWLELERPQAESVIKSGINNS